MTSLMLRQGGLISAPMQEAQVLLVGLGMLGSWTAQSLSRTCQNVIGMDFDTVGPENYGTQSYNLRYDRRNKAEALAELLDGLNYRGVAEKFHPTLNTSTGVWSPAPAQMGFVGDGPLVVVSAVDSLEGRDLIARWASTYGALFIDTRAHGNVGVVVTFDPGDKETLATYRHGLDVAKQQDVEPACGLEGTAYVGMWVAATVTAHINRALRGFPFPPFTIVRDVLNGEDILVQQVAPTGEAVTMR